MDRFITRENIKRYRKLASESTDSTERSRLMKLLAEEEAKFKLELKVATAMVCVPKSPQLKRDRNTV